jgi:hypothetical protein
MGEAPGPQVGKKGEIRAPSFVPIDPADEVEPPRKPSEPLDRDISGLDCPANGFRRGAVDNFGGIEANCRKS